MLKCTYVVLLSNNENNISCLIKSLQNTVGNFTKEFIIIDDGSKDNSLTTVKFAVNDLPRTTIITQQTQGPAISINKAISLANGDYIHFVEGDEILHPESTMIMIDSCKKLGAEVACIKGKEVENATTFPEKLPIQPRLIQVPITQILLNKIKPLRNIGGSGSLVARNLLEKTGKADSSIYSQTMSMSLRCAKYSNFVFVNNILTFKQKNLTKLDRKFESYNNLRAAYNFASSHPEICQTIIPELLQNLSLEMLSQKLKVKYYLQSIRAKYSKTLPLDKVLEFYKTEYEKLF
ncbi:MAG: glycosyltransferase [Rickettsiaceae bacterium]|nr:glycosyltransferase [Rickettsiaceae bacterium]MCP5377626.1 glycosyltransferase [Rickettsiaceae bacterium]